MKTSPFIRRKLLCFASCAAFTFSIYAQVAPGGEQVETGHAETENGSHSYRIRLLPLASFPDLPPEVAHQLDLRHCLIPQTYEARRPENVIHGAFSSKGSSDWAVLCSVSSTTRLLVFFHGNEETPFTLATFKDTERLGAEIKSRPFGSAWGISTISPDPEGKLPGVGDAGPFDHDAIKDEFVERLATVRYYRNGIWQGFENGGS